MRGRLCQELLVFITLSVDLSFLELSLMEVCGFIHSYEKCMDFTIKANVIT